MKDFSRLCTGCVVDQRSSPELELPSLQDYNVVRILWLLNIYWSIWCSKIISDLYLKTKEYKFLEK